MEQSVAAANAKVDGFNKNLEALTHENLQIRISSARATSEYENSKTVVEDKRKENLSLMSELRKTHEALTLANLTIERQRKGGEAKAIPSSQKEAQLQKEVDKCMSILKCSTCKQNMRSTVLTKCLHTFCKSCIDMRISTRQRKCPACNLQFAQSDAQQLYFQ
jgi:E3 ubiquitin-protein ligase BRE1